MVSDTVPLYALYALWFADTGLSDGEISFLFLLWSAVGFLFEVPSGVLADRFTRRGCLIWAAAIQAVGYALWTAFPGFGAFAVGFALWGISGSLISGAYEALVYDSLAAVGAQGQYGRIQGYVTAITMTAQVPAALSATLLLSMGGYSLVGWASVGVCVGSAVLALRFREPPRSGDEESDEQTSYVTTLRSGLRTAARDPVVRAGVIVVALLGGLDGVDEYFPLLAQDWRVPTEWVPVAILVIPAAGALGAGLAGAANRLSGRTLAGVLAVSMVLLSAAAVLQRPIGLLGVALFYALYQMVLVAADARLQHRITGHARATVTSIASLGTQVAVIGLYLGWAAGGLWLVVAAGLLIALALPRLR